VGRTALLFILLVALGGSVGCLPAYNDAIGPPDAGPGPGDAGPGDGGGSGLFASGKVVALETETRGSGVTVEVDGFPSFMSMPTDNQGAFMFQIPADVVAANAPHYVIMDGMFMGKPVLKTWIAPRIKLDGSTANQNLLFHVFQSPSDPLRVQSIIANDLANHGDIPSAGSFTTDYVFQYGAHFQLTDFGFNAYQGYTVAVDNLDNTNCKPSLQCCVYYSLGLAEFVLANPPKTSMIDFTLTKSPGHFVVVCPASQTGDVTLTSGGTPFDSLGNPPPTPFNPVQAPRVKGVGVYVDWQIPR
jgi:hypothetical protein